ncbi:MAG: DEAD/DEAH box helicase [Myxococcota bacterium]
MTTFDPFPLPAGLRDALRELGFTAPTPIQAAALPPLLEGRDVVGQARTGTGKTAAFGLPLLARLSLGRRQVQALVLCPTRELALQVTSDLRAFGKRLPGLRVVPTVGGQPRELQARTLREGAHVVVGTPGRTLDHLRRGSLDPRAIGALVLDEADRMLELGFATDMEAIRAQLPQQRQTMLFSATFPPAVAALSAGWQTDPASIAVEAPSVELTAWAAVVEDPAAALAPLLRALQPESALVFSNFVRAAADIAEALRRAGFSAAALHGDLDQVERDRVMAGFRNGSVRVLVATDVAARGLDVDGLELVVNLGLPSSPDDYLPRVGRTGRAGRPGVAWSLVEREPLPGGATRAPPPAAGDDAPPLIARWATLRLGAGRADKLRPADLLGALTGACGLAAEQVGKFEIHDRWAFVAIDVAAATQAARALGRFGVKGRRVRVERV